MPNCLHQVGFTKTNASVNVERVVLCSSGRGNMFGSRNSQLIGVTVDVSFKRESGSSPVSSRRLISVSDGGCDVPDSSL